MHFICDTCGDVFLTHDEAVGCEIGHAGIWASGTLSDQAVDCEESVPGSRRIGGDENIEGGWGM